MNLTTFFNFPCAVCVVNGTIYRSGSAMTSSSLCSYCYCIAGRQKCVQPKCVLASPGCQPIYSDSTCCPIRYDCTKRNAALQADAVNALAAKADEAADGFASASSAGAGSRIVHHSNKHFMRTQMQRTQRSRGCIVGAHFYQEGLKMPHDPLHPCNICFCIRGAAKCTPKRCAPAIANCTPIVPPGQCCPASYECDHSADDGVVVDTNGYEQNRLALASKSRQFDFLSMFFDDEDATTNGTTTTTAPIVGGNLTGSASGQPTNASASDSIFAAIEAGLKYIESNDDRVGSMLDQTVARNATVTKVVSPTPRPQRDSSTSTTTEKELSFLDIFLGDDDEDEEQPELRAPAVSPLPDATTEHIHTSTHRMEDRMSTPNDYEETTVIITKYAPTMTTSTSPTTLGQEFTSTPNTENASTTSELSGDLSTVTESLETDTDAGTTSDATESVSDSNTSTTNAATTNTATDRTESTETTDANSGGDTRTESTVSDAQTTVDESTTAAAVTPSEAVRITNSTSVSISSSTRPSVVLNVTTATIRPTTENIFSALFDGISSMFTEQNGTATALNKLYKIRVNTDRNATHRTPTHPAGAGAAKPTPLPGRVRNATATSTQPPPATKSRPTPIPLSQPGSGGGTVSSSSIPPPLPAFVQSNPSILDAELNYDYGEPPTLPPSLPNLKIIPFLPTDAVKTNRNPLHGYGGNFYDSGVQSARPHSSSSGAVADFDTSDDSSFPGDAQPVLTLDDQLQLSKESKDGNEFELFHVGAQMSGTGAGGGVHAGSHLTSDEQQDARRPAYPSITESIYGVNDPTRFDAETQQKIYPSYQYLLEKLNTQSQTKTTEAAAAPGYDIVTDFEKFVTAYPDKVGGPIFDGHDRFSPPSETQGKFDRAI